MPQLPTLKIPISGRINGKPVVYGYSKVLNDDFGKMLSQLRWCRSSWGYVRRNKPKINGIHQGFIYLHKVVYEHYHGPITSKMVVDHIDRDVLNNTPENLREANKSLNGANCSRRSHNTSGYTGVKLHRASGLWHACITVDKQVISLKYYKTPEEAAEVVNEAFRTYRPGIPVPNEV